MPQLDSVSFFSQFFWLIIFFGGFFLALVQFFLPKLARVLKFRQEKFDAIRSQSESYLLETQSHQQKRSENYSKSLNLQKTLGSLVPQAQKETSEQLWENSLSLAIAPKINLAYKTDKAFFETHMVIQNLAMILFSLVPATTSGTALTLSVPAVSTFGYVFFCAESGADKVKAKAKAKGTGAKGA